MPIKAIMRAVAHREGRALAMARLSAAAQFRTPRLAREWFARISDGSTLLASLLRCDRAREVDDGYWEVMREAANRHLLEGVYRGGLIQRWEYDSAWAGEYQEMRNNGWTHPRLDKVFRILIDRQNNNDGIGEWPKDKFYDHIHGADFR